MKNKLLPSIWRYGPPLQTLVGFFFLTPFLSPPPPRYVPPLQTLVGFFFFFLTPFSLPPPPPLGMYLLCVCVHQFLIYIYIYIYIYKRLVTWKNPCIYILCTSSFGFHICQTHQKIGICFQRFFLPNFFSPFKKKQQQKFMDVHVPIAIM